LHSIIAAPGTWDPNTGDSLITVFPGEPYVARLGHTVGGIHRAQLKYSVYVDSTTYLFVYRYAVVLQDPGHAAVNEPSFTIEVLDSTGTLIDSCGYYFIFSPVNPNDPLPATWHKHGTGQNTVIWKEWTTVGMSLVNQFGKTVTIVFDIKDCRQGGHFGYAYLSAYCSYITLQTSMCQGDTSATLTAPPGFRYLWSTTDTTQSIVVPHPTTGDTISCVLTALNGCQVTITQVLTYTEIHTNFTHGVSCTGVGTQFNDSSWVTQNHVFNWKWNFNDGSPEVIGVKDPVHIFANSGDYNVSLKSFSTEGCADSIIKVVHVDSLPVITNNQLTKTICSRGNTNITFTCNVTNPIFSWTASSKNGTTTGFSNSSGNPLSQVLINTGQHTDTVHYVVTPHKGGCDGFPVDFSVAVRPLPAPLINSRTQSICDSTLTNLNVTPYSDSTKFTWTCTASSVNLTGYSNNTSTPDTLINQRLINTGWNNDTVYYHLVPVTFGCIGDTFIYKVAVHPLPDLTNIPLSKSICSGSNTALPLTSHVTGTQYTWTCTASSPGITGWSNNAVPVTVLNQQLFNTNMVSGTVTYDITPHANGCDGHVYHYMVTVKPIPTVSNTVNPSICSGTLTSIILASDMGGSTYSWTASGSSANVSGYFNSSGPVISQPLTNTGLVNETVTYSVSASNNGCTGNSHDILVTVFPVADVYFTPSSQAICSGLNTNLALASHVPGATYSWWGSGSSGFVSGYSSGITNPISQTLVNSWINKEIVTYYALPTANGCPGAQGDADVTVYPVPVVSFTRCNDPVTILTAMPFLLRGGIPLGGIYSGAGVNAGVFTPANAGTGTHTLTYQYSNYLGCSRNATQTITVLNPAPFLCGNTLTDVRDGKTYPTIKLGTRCWLAANLNYGVKIPVTTMQRDNCINEKYCPGDLAANCTSYGGLYQWDELMAYDNSGNAQGLCPPGWHVPTGNEWNTLFALYLGNGFAGAPLKYTGYSGFDAFLSSMWLNNVRSSFFDFAAMFWTSTEHAPLKAWAHGMNDINPSVSDYPSSKTNAFAVRCIQD